MDTSFQADFDSYRSKIENRLEGCFSKTIAPSLTDAMRYSVLAGGKRVRAVMTLAFCEACRGNVDAVLDAACAVELLHTYSLIHDDLPSMDNDDMRRGKPSNHKVFGEWRAILAGDALQAAAFEWIARCPLPPERIVMLIRIFSAAVGERGMCAGQTLDMEAEERGGELDAQEISRIHELKTSALILAAAQIGVHAADGSDAQQLAAHEYARAVGMAFQIRDDVLDATATSEQLGKPSGSDAESGKTTFYTLFGREKCEELIAAETEKAKLAVRTAFSDSRFLEKLADNLAGRDK